MKCEVCGSTKNVSRELSASTLLFGPFRSYGGYHGSWQNRCLKCEKKLSEKLLSILDK